MNDLSVGDFDIVVSDIESSTTQRRAKAMLVTDALSKLGVPPEIVMLPMLELYDIPKRDQLIQAYKQMQLQQPPQMPEMQQMPQTAEIPRDPQQIENQQKPQTMTSAAAQSLVSSGMPTI